MFLVISSRQSLKEIKENHLYKETFNGRSQFL